MGRLARRHALAIVAADVHMLEMQTDNHTWILRSQVQDVQVVQGRAATPSNGRQGIAATAAEI
jgi:hypothetical protein